MQIQQRKGLDRGGDRKGAILILVATAIVTLTILLAFVVDVNRLFLQRSELQTASDAAAHAGALQLALRDFSNSNIDNAASAIGRRNAVIGQSPTFPGADVSCGSWDPTDRDFTAGSCDDEADAVRVVGHDPSRYIFGPLIGAADVVMTTPSIAWIAPMVASSTCTKPIAIAYSELTSRLDGGSGNGRDLTALDISSLINSSQSQLSVSMTQRAPPNASNQFGALNFGNGGAAGYRSYLAGTACFEVNPGDVIPAPASITTTDTRASVCTLCSQPSFCSGPPNKYPCRTAGGATGVVVRVPLFDATSGNSLTIRIVTAFSIDTITNNGTGIKGHFVRALSNGRIATKRSGLARIVLVNEAP